MLAAPETFIIAIIISRSSSITIKNSFFVEILNRHFFIIIWK